MIANSQTVLILFRGEIDYIFIIYCRYVAQLELYLTNGQTLTSNEVEFVTKPVKKEEENVIPQGKLLQW